MMPFQAGPLGAGKQALFFNETGVSAMAKLWFVTWTTYGSWLPGDPRGFQTWRGKEYIPPPPRYARGDEPTYDPAYYRERWRRIKKICPNPVLLSPLEQQLALTAVVQEIATLSLVPHILSIGRWHVHLVSEFGLLRIRPTVGRLKSTATRALPNPGTRKRVWTDGCHMESLTTTTAVNNAVEYVRRHRDEGALIHEW